MGARGRLPVDALTTASSPRRSNGPADFEQPSVGRSPEVIESGDGYSRAWDPSGFREEYGRCNSVRNRILLKLSFLRYASVRYGCAQLQLSEL